MAKTTKSLQEAMQALFTRLTLSQSRKKQFHQYVDFQVAIVTIGCIDIGLGKDSDGDFAVFQCSKSTETIGRLVCVISFKGSRFV